MPRGELVVGGGNADLELEPFALEPVCAVRRTRGEPLLAALLRASRVDAQEHCHLREAAGDRNLVEALDHSDPEAARRALVRAGRIYKPIAHDVAALLERGPDHPRAELCPRAA